MPINADKEIAEEVKKVEIEVPAAANDYVVDEIVDKFITEIANKKSDVVIDENNMMVISLLKHDLEAGDKDTPNNDDTSGQEKKKKYGRA